LVSVDEVERELRASCSGPSGPSGWSNRRVLSPMAVIVLTLSLVFLWTTRGSSEIAQASTRSLLSVVSSYQRNLATDTASKARSDSRELGRLAENSQEARRHLSPYSDSHHVHALQRALTALATDAKRFAKVAHHVSLEDQRKLVIEKAAVEALCGEIENETP
jgi:hypothetical protein